MKVLIHVCSAAALAAALLAPASELRSQGSVPAAAPARLLTYPEQVYFTTANVKERLSGTVLMLIVEEPAGQSSTPQVLELAYKNAGSTVRTDRLLTPALEAVDIPNFPPARLHSAEAAKRVSWPHAYRLVVTLPAKANVDSIEARLTTQRKGAPDVVAGTIPVRSYEQKISLDFPFKGAGIVSQGGALTSGHRNRSGLYAIDALGLSPTYGPMRVAQPDEDPASYAGWGREIIAPGAGKIVVARSDRPDQPVAGKSDPAYFFPAYPDGGDPGNHVVIDHGNGEFSMIAHMQKGSVRVTVGDRVVQGQVLGLLGNSGDTSGPHVHYQLQNGPDWERSDALPPRFSNVESTDRGSYFTAK